jgi:hypothetical protein
VPVTIQIPVRTHENFGDSISKLIKTLSEISSIQEEEIVLDFSHTRILNPFFLCGLTCVIQRLQKSGKRFTPNYDKNLNVSSYLNTILFPSTLSASGGKDTLSILEKYRAKTYIPIISFKTGFSDSCTSIRVSILMMVTPSYR